MIITTMKKPLLALLAVAAVAVLAVVVIMENTPERRMDRRIDRLLRSYDDPKQLYQRLVDDRDLLGFAIVGSFLRYNGPRCSCTNTTNLVGWHNEDCDYPTYQKQHYELYADFSTQIVVELCDCGKAPLPVFSGHPADCNLTRARQDMQKTWLPYILRKNKEFHEAQLNR